MKTSCSLGMDDLEAELEALEHILYGPKEPDSLDYQLLRRLTNNFSDDRRIGEGGCGEVYKGILPNGEVIAVKKLKNNYQIVDERTFLREVDSMIKVEHQNIVRFLGYCSEIKHKAFQVGGMTIMAEDRVTLLCFQYLRNGSLDKYLADELRGFEWHTRYQILKGICDGLLHLHNEKGILHMDLKPANILLDDQMVPKITDFGLSRIDGKTQVTSAQRLFTPGYAAVEYINTGERSFKSDIYSLGVIMTELVTGRREMPNSTKVLRRWRHRWNKSSKHTLLWYLQVKKCLDLAVGCKEENPINRPFILDIVNELNNIDSWDGQIRESSLGKIVSSPDDMLGIEPLELHFTLAHKKQISCSTELTNDTYYYMAFRVVTTSVLPFSIQPNKGIAAPGSRCRITITLPAQDMAKLQNHRKLKESIVAQSTRIDGSPAAVDVTVDMFSEEGGVYSKNNKNVVDKVVDQVNLTIRFDMLHEMGSLGTSSQVAGDGGAAGPSLGPGWGPHFRQAGTFLVGSIPCSLSMPPITPVMDTSLSVMVAGPAASRDVSWQRDWDPMLLEAATGAIATAPTVQMHMVDCAASLRAPDASCGEMGFISSFLLHDVSLLSAHASLAPATLSPAGPSGHLSPIHVEALGTDAVSTEHGGPVEADIGPPPDVDTNSNDGPEDAGARDAVDLFIQQLQLGMKLDYPNSVID